MPSRAMDRFMACVGISILVWVVYTGVSMMVVLSQIDWAKVMR